MFQVEVFWFVTLYSDVVGYQRFRGPYCLYIQSQVGDRFCCKFVHTAQSGEIFLPSVF